MKGICIVITNPNGQVVASAVDFDGPTAGGFTHEQEQRRRAKQTALIDFARGHLNEWLAAKADRHFAYDLWALAERAGYKMQEIPVSDEAAA